jgi:hypothetical protein
MAGVLGNFRTVVNSDGTETLVTASGTLPFTTLTNLSALNTAGAVQDGGTLHANAIMQVTSGAGVSAGSVQLQGSVDGTNWFNLGTATNTNAASTVFAPVVVTGTAVRYVRAFIATGITGGTISAIVGMSG